VERVVGTEVLLAVMGVPAGVKVAAVAAAHQMCARAVLL
jgi:hypothetical protein